MNNLFTELEELLKSDERFVAQDGKVLRNAVYESANKMDEKLLTLLTTNENIKKAFFKEVNNMLVFDKQEFNFMINNRELLPDSYTRFKQKIGLVDSKNDFIVSKDDVVLSFPFKDCLLEFDSTDPEKDRKEIFYNEILTRDRIDSLLEKKVLTNSKMFNNNGEVKTETYNKQENLLIKGNNLIVLNSLLPVFGGQIKLMYWDVLYNTKDDKVPYADSFKHSSWLVMMKNRLEVAKKLLKDDGVICIQCDDNEMAYLKVLCDEIFSRENVFNCVVVKMSDASGPKMAHIEKKFPKLKEYIIMCKKGDIRINIVTEEKLKWDDEYKIFFDLETSIFEELKSSDITESRIKEINELLLTNVISLEEAFTKYKIKKDERFTFCKDNAYRIARSSNSSSVQKIIESLKEVQDNMVIKFNNEWIFVKTNYDKSAKTPRVQYVFAGDTMNVPLCDLWTEINTSFNEEGGVTLKNGQKPEKLLYYIIKSLSNENDIVLDAYFGTGTTGAVAMKMGRRFIGIEQLDSHIELANKRLLNVINGDETGISKSQDVNWKGGGSFVYCELKKLNEYYIDKISNISDKENLLKLASEILHSDFISCNIDVKKGISEFGKAEDLDIEDIKRILFELLDKNQLYVNFSDIDDENMFVSDLDKKFTKHFYGVD